MHGFADSGRKSASARTSVRHREDLPEHLARRQNNDVCAAQLPYEPWSQLSTTGSPATAR